MKIRMLACLPERVYAYVYVCRLNLFNIYALGNVTLLRIEPIVCALPLRFTLLYLFFIPPSSLASKLVPSPRRLCVYNVNPTLIRYSISSRRASIGIYFNIESKLPLERSLFFLLLSFLYYCRSAGDVLYTAKIFSRDKTEE